MISISSAESSVAKWPELQMAPPGSPGLDASIMEHRKCSRTLWKPMENMETYGKLWKPMENYGKLWKPMENYGKLWKPMGNYGKRWKTMENLQVL